jgi:hypothetical protein
MAECRSTNCHSNIYWVDTTALQPSTANVQHLALDFLEKLMKQLNMTESKTFWIAVQTFL